MKEVSSSEIDYDIPASSSCFKVEWTPSHPNKIRPYDSYRMRKKKMKRWPTEEDLIVSYAWLIPPNEDYIFPFRGKNITVNISSTDSDETDF
jgi:hypothetical protein